MHEEVTMETYHYRPRPLENQEHEEYTARSLPTHLRRRVDRRKEGKRRFYSADDFAEWLLYHENSPQDLSNRDMNLPERTPDNHDWSSSNSDFESIRTGGWTPQNNRLRQISMPNTPEFAIMPKNRFEMGEPQNTRDEDTWSEGCMPSDSTPAFQTSERLEYGASDTFSYSTATMPVPQSSYASNELAHYPQEMSHHQHHQHPRQHNSSNPHNSRNDTHDHGHNHGLPHASHAHYHGHNHEQNHHHHHRQHIPTPQHSHSNLAPMHLNSQSKFFDGCYPPHSNHGHNGAHGHNSSMGFRPPHSTPVHANHAQEFPSQHSYAPPPLLHQDLDLPSGQQHMTLTPSNGLTPNNNINNNLSVGSHQSYAGPFGFHYHTNNSSSTPSNNNAHEFLGPPPPPPQQHGKMMGHNSHFHHLSSHHHGFNSHPRHENYHSHSINRNGAETTNAHSGTHSACASQHSTYVCPPDGTSYGPTNKGRYNGPSSGPAGHHHNHPPHAFHNNHSNHNYHLPHEAAHWGYPYASSNPIHGNGGSSQSQRRQGPSHRGRDITRAGYRGDSPFRLDGASSVTGSSPSRYRGRGIRGMQEEKEEANNNDVGFMGRRFSIEGDQRNPMMMNDGDQIKGMNKMPLNFYGTEVSIEPTEHTSSPSDWPRTPTNSMRREQLPMSPTREEQNVLGRRFEAKSKKVVLDLDSGLQPPSKELPACAAKWAPAMHGYYTKEDILETDSVPEMERTTVMMKNIPNKYTQDSVMELIHGRGFKSSYDFLYLPIDFRSKSNMGYAFINFCTPEDAQRFAASFTGYQEWGFNSLKVCEVTWSRPFQGLAAHIDRYRNSPTMHNSIPMEFKPAIFFAGQRLPFPPPTRPIASPKRKDGRSKELFC